MRLPGRRVQDIPAMPGAEPCPADGAPRDRTDSVRGDGVRGLLAIALAWTLVVTALVAVHPVNANRPAGGGRATFEIQSVEGVKPDDSAGGTFTTDRNLVAIVLQIEGTGDVECWNQDTDDYDSVTGGGTRILEVGVQEGRNTIECTTYALFPQTSSFYVVYEPPTATPQPPKASTQPAASGEPYLFAITAIDGRTVGDAAGRIFEVHQPTVRIDIDQLTAATVSCTNYDAGWTWETEPRRGVQYLEITLRPGPNAITCEAGRGASQRVRFEVEFVVDPAPSLDPAAVVITTVDGQARNTIPEHGYTTWSKQIVLRGSAPDPGVIVCTGAACEGREVYVTGATTWAVQLELEEGTNRVEVHAANDPSNSDRISVELIP